MIHSSIVPRLTLPGLLRAAIFIASAASAAGAPAVVRFKARCLQDLVGSIPGILESQDRTNGQFGKGIWIVTDQNVIFPLAAAWSYQDSANPYYHSRELLDAVMAGGDALIADADERGMWEFRKRTARSGARSLCPGRIRAGCGRIR